MENFLQALTGTDKTIIGCVHLLPLPGTPQHDAAGGLRRIAALAREDAKRLVQGGIDALLFVNEGDRPYAPQADQAAVAAMAAVVAAVAPEVSVPYGANVLVDPAAAIAIAHATGGRFIRGFVAGGFIPGLGPVQARAPEILRLRRLWGAEEVGLICNLTSGLGVAEEPGARAEGAAGTVFNALVDALCVPGPGAGVPVRAERLREVRRAAPSLPVLVGTGLTPGNAAELLAEADGAIVGTSLKVDGQIFNPVDEQRVRALKREVEQIRRR